MENKIIKNASSVFSGRKMVGIYLFFGQRLYFGHMTKNYSDKLHVNTDNNLFTIDENKMHWRIEFTIQIYRMLFYVQIADKKSRE